MHGFTRRAVLIAAVASLLIGCKGEKPDNPETEMQSAASSDNSTPSQAPSPDTSGPQEDGTAIDLEKRHLWDDRVILLFANNSNAPNYRSMESALAGSEAGVRDRKLVVYHIFSDDMGRVEGEPLQPGQAQTLRRRFDVSPDTFTYILLGLDGTQKMRSRDVVAVETIFNTIDSMPMRQQEIRRRNSP